MGYTPQTVVIGGGAVGTAIARDLAIRGLDVTLLTRGTVASGPAGRSPGVLYSGAQFAIGDPAIAKRCLAENRTLFETAGHCIEDTGGLLVGHRSDSVSIRDVHDACQDCNIASRLVSGDDIRDREDSLSDGIDEALVVPDAVIDPFRLSVATARDAAEYGATIHTHTEVTDIRVENGSVSSLTIRKEPVPAPATGSPFLSADGGRPQSKSPANTGMMAPPAGGTHAAPNYYSEEIDPVTSADRPDSPLTRADTRTDESTDKQVPWADTDETDSSTRREPIVEEISADYVINAAARGAPRIANLAGASLPVTRDEDTVVVADGRQTETVVTTAGDGPPRVVTHHGTNSLLVAPTHEVGEDGGQSPLAASPVAVDATIDTLAGEIPDIRSARTLRAFSRHRLRVNGPDRPAAHGQGHLVVDHADHHDRWGLLTVVGGSLTTHRYVAEHVSDRVCEAFGISRECQTDELPLPGSADEPFPGADDAEIDPREEFGVSETVYERTVNRLGGRTGSVLGRDGVNPVVCPCQSVTRAELRAAAADETAQAGDLDELRIRTTAGMGICQCGRCVHRLVAAVYSSLDADQVDHAIDTLLDGRLRGQRSATWGVQLREVARNYRLHTSTLDRTDAHRETPILDVYDKGRAEPCAEESHPALEPTGDVPGDGLCRMIAKQLDDARPRSDGRAVGPEGRAPFSPRGERI